MPNLGENVEPQIKNQILNGSEYIEKFCKSQILATNRYGWPEIEGKHTYQQDLQAVNQLYLTGDMCYQNNCQRCVIAYEARRRGYDVCAKPYLFRTTDLLQYDDQKGWPSIFVNSVLEPCGANSSKDLKANIYSKMKSWGEGSRAIVAVDFQQGYGHVFVAEYINGIVHYMDPQNAQLDCEEYFEIINTRTAVILRTDNCVLSDQVKECCEGIADR